MVSPLKLHHSHQDSVEGGRPERGRSSDRDEKGRAAKSLCVREIPEIKSAKFADFISRK